MITWIGLTYGVLLAVFFVFGYAACWFTRPRMKPAKHVTQNAEVTKVAKTMRSPLNARVKSMRQEKELNVYENAVTADGTIDVKRPGGVK